MTQTQRIEITTILTGGGLCTVGIDVTCQAIDRPAIRAALLAAIVALHGAKSLGAVQHQRGPFAVSPEKEAQP